MIKILSTERFPEGIGEKFNEIPEFDLQFISAGDLRAPVEAEALIIDNFRLQDSLFRKGSNLRIVVKLGKNFSQQELQLLDRNRIHHVLAPSGKAAAVAEYVITMILMFSRGIHTALNSPRREMGEEVRGKILGVVGFGETGMATAEAARRHGVRVLYHDKQKKACDPNYIFSSLEEIFSQSDFVSIHLPDSGETDGLISARELKLIKKPLLLINSSGHRSINQRDLTEAIRENRIKSAIYDCGSREQLEPELLQTGTVFVTPAIASYTRESFLRVGLELLKTLQDFFNV